MDIVWLLLVGLIAGWLAGVVMKGGGYGIVGDMIIGIVGAFIGGMIFRSMNITAYGTFGAIVVAFIGAVILIAILRMLSPRRA